MSRFDVVEAEIAQLRNALETGRVTSVGLVDAYLARIEAFDRHGPQFNAVVVLNCHAREEARVSDERRSRRGSLGPLDGIPYTAKDSYLATGLTAAAGWSASAVRSDRDNRTGPARRALHMLEGSANAAFGGLRSPGVGDTAQRHAAANQLSAGLRSSLLRPQRGELTRSRKRVQRGLQSAACFIEGTIRDSEVDPEVTRRLKRLTRYDCDMDFVEQPCGERRS